ncbi:hypothetical protein XA68_14252 [Ophiocordyceps unilateralis]|uniref:Uncharacterized protein n=1 Tax=Ophiocordyceps unilateralis TaxID=268505 RepID=A0A2A9P9Q3_OPHUN|nr:hypothetical protein XA68_14252 [Ophiocordyceps unilateralis]
MQCKSISTRSSTTNTRPLGRIAFVFLIVFFVFLLHLWLTTENIVISFLAGAISQITLLHNNNSRSSSSSAN